jgi:hypothetical protein
LPNSPGCVERCRRTGAGLPPAGLLGWVLASGLVIARTGGSDEIAESQKPDPDVADSRSHRHPVDHTRPSRGPDGDREQRALAEKVQHIDILVTKLARDATTSETVQAKNDLVLQVIHSEAQSLTRSLDSFDSLRLGIAMKPVALSQALVAAFGDGLKWAGVDTGKEAQVSAAQLALIADKVRGVATKSVQIGNGEKQEEQDWEEFDHASSALAAAYGVLHDAAEKERESSAAWAGNFRVIAWIFTAIGALMLGGVPGLSAPGSKDEPPGDASA